MRSILKFIINILLLVGIVWLLIKFTPIDDRVKTLWTKNTGSIITIDWSGDKVDTSCQTPRWVKIPNGWTIFAYKDVLPTKDWLCEEEIRTCNKWVLGGTFGYPSCLDKNSQNVISGSDNGIAINGIVDDLTIPVNGASCETPRWQTIKNGNYIVSYQSPSSCTFQRRLCVDGVLFGKFEYNYCILPTYFSATQDSNEVVYDANNIDESPYSVWSARQYAQVNYGGLNSTQTLPSDYWNENQNGNVAVVSSSSSTAKTSSPKTYATPKDTSSTAYYDLTQRGCTTPWGTFVDHGQYIIAYRTSTPASWRSCEYERRSCNYGKLSGTFTASKCTSKGKTYTSTSWAPWNESYTETTIPTRSAACKLPRWGYIANWSYVKAYKYSNSSYADACQWEYRFCRNGVLDGTYTKNSCVLVNTYTPAKNCSLPRWWTIADGQSVVAYASRMGYCNAQTRTCSNWYLNGSYQYSNCTNNTNNRCSLPRWWSIADGQSVVAYASPTGSCNAQTRTCSDGYLHGSYQYSYCENYSNNRCSLPRWWSIADGQSVVAYASPTGDCNAKQTRVCSDGYLHGSYQYANCTNSTYAKCTLPRWWSIADGQSVVAYVSPTGDCNVKQTRVCSDGYLHGSYQYSTCRNTTPDISMTDIYSDWQNLGRLNEAPDTTMDTCNNDIQNKYTCSANESRTCVDYEKVENDCCIAGRAKYQKRSIECVQ